MNRQAARAGKESQGHPDFLLPLVSTVSRLLDSRTSCQRFMGLPKEDFLLGVSSHSTEYVVNMNHVVVPMCCFHSIPNQSRHGNGAVLHFHTHTQNTPHQKSKKVKSKLTQIPNVADFTRNWERSKELRSQQCK